MNIEYVNNGDTIIVSDENGKMSVLENTYENAEKYLILQNRVEIIQNKINELVNKINEKENEINENNKFLNNKQMILMCSFYIGTFLSFVSNISFNTITNFINNENIQITNITNTPLFWATFFTSNILFNSISLILPKIKNKKIEEEIENLRLQQKKAETIKKCIDNDFEKEYNKQFSKNVVVDNSKSQEPISLVSKSNEASLVVEKNLSSIVPKKTKRKVLSLNRIQK